MKNTLLFILSLAALSFSACEKEKTPSTELEKLPAATQEGKNTFGCLVDGKAWTTKGSPINPGVQPYYDERLKVFQLQAIYKEESSFQLVVTDVVQTGNYLPLPNFSYYSIASKDCSQLGYKEYQILTGGNVQITRLDIGQGIVSGTFEFDAVSETCQDTVRITDGRFDIKYKF